MRSTFQRVCLLGGAAATIAGAALTAGAGAQTAMPAPGCAGMSTADAAGDAVRLESSGQKSPDNMDILGLFFTYQGGKTYANMQLADASDALPEGAEGARWYVTFKAKGATRWVRASHNVTDGVTFSYGHDEPGSRVKDGDIAGKFIAGKPGVLQLPIPAAAGGAAGTVLADPFAETDEAYLLPNQSVPPVPPTSWQRFPNDLAPDEEGKYGASYTVGSCETAPAGTGGGTGGGGTGGGSTQQLQETANLPVKAASKGGSARKVSKKKKLRLRVQSSESVSNLVARLFKGDPARPKVFATGKLASLNGKGTITLKTAKRIKKGTYSLRIDGTLADGRKGVANFKVKLAR